MWQKCQSFQHWVQRRHGADEKARRFLARQDGAKSGNWNPGRIARGGADFQPTTELDGIH
jgi:hypothetical protein